MTVVTYVCCNRQAKEGMRIFMKMSKNYDKTDITLMLIVLILIIINLIVYTKYFTQSKKEPVYQITKSSVTSTGSTSKNSKKETVTVPKNEEELIKKLSTQSERDRLEYYCGVYFKHLEHKEYEEAYKLLYKEFKDKYFPTLDKYKEYIKKTYPQNWALEYDDITRQGNIYVLKLKILDILGNKENEKSQRIVIRENTYNDFVISFQVI